jgi:hypothetical protein
MKPLVRIDVFPDGLRVTMGEETLHLKCNSKPFPSVEIYKCRESDLMTMMPDQVLHWTHK